MVGKCDRLILCWCLFVFLGTFVSGLTLSEIEKPHLDSNTALVTDEVVRELNNTSENNDLKTSNQLNINITKTADSIRLTDVHEDVEKFNGLWTRQKTSFKLPEKWMSACSIDGTELYESEFTSETELLKIRCIVGSENSNVVNVHDLNEVTNPSADVKLSLDIQCLDYAAVKISWPIKIRNLYTISVKECKIRDYYQDFKSQTLDTIPDSLRVIKYSNNVVIFPLSMFTEMITKVDEFSKEYNCGHEETIEVLSMINQTEEFILDIVPESLDILQASEEYMRDFRRIKHTCDFRHLMVIDESQAESQSTYKMQTLIQHSIFDQLRVFNQSHSFIKSIKEPILHWSVHFPSLELFDLSWNNISGLYRFEIPVQASRDKITTINLQHNNISMITLQQLERLALMPSVFIDIRHNPIDCTCSEDIEQLLGYIHAKHFRNISHIANYSYLEDLQCATPNNLKGITLGALQVMDVCPVETSTEYFVAPIIVLVVSVVILILLLILVLRYRQDIQIILFTRFDIIVPCQSRVAGRDKKYDAFVSYSSNDEDWIEDFFEDMEKKPLHQNSYQFRFCMHHRDFIPGKTIFDNVINSVESSRHTIILLSKHYLGSEFCLYEFQEAFRQSVMEQKRHLIIVMMEDIPEADLPRDLRRCIKTFTYIRKDDRLFAQRLRFALTIKQKSKKVSSSPNKDFNSDLATPSVTQLEKQKSKLSVKLGTSKISTLLSSKKHSDSKSTINNNSNKAMVQLEDIVEIASNSLRVSGATNLAYVNEIESKNDLGKSTSPVNVQDNVKDRQITLNFPPVGQNESSTDDDTCNTNQENSFQNSDLYDKSNINGYLNIIQEVNSESAMSNDPAFLDNNKKSISLTINNMPISSIESPEVTSQAFTKCPDSVDRLDSFSKSVMESRLLEKHAGYDRSISCLSADTGYGSDRGSCNDRNLQEICETP